MADVPSPPLCPTPENAPLTPLPLHQENFIKSVLARNAGADTVT